jgi:ABC-type proline/glycine betaine transport system substrate-binding protein
MLNKFGVAKRKAHVGSLLATFVLGVLVAGAASAGSIVINDKDPESALEYRDDAGKTKNLIVSWSDLQLIAKVKAYLLKTYGAAGKEKPYMIDRASQSVSILVDRAKATYETLSFADLKDF